jgi:rRNA-processing protein FCF1
MASSSSVLLDTNFVLSCYRFGISLDHIHDVVEEPHTVYVPLNVLEELKRLPLTGKDKEARSVMLAILKSYPTLPLEGPVDASLLEYARIHACIICTNDKKLRKHIKDLGKKTIFVRSHSHLALE